MIRKAVHQDINTIIEITKACAIHMQSVGIFQWNEHYPNRLAFENDLKRGELYVFTASKKVIGTIVVSTLMDEVYKPVKWLSSSDKSIYVHRLCVHPNFQGKGCAQQLMDFTENVARKNNYDSIRLDTFSQNKRNQKFYERRGYKRLEAIYFPKQSTFPFYCYELLL